MEFEDFGSGVRGIKGMKNHFLRFRLLRICWVVCLSLGGPSFVQASCLKPIYLTFDTGNMSVAKHVADVLRKHGVRATFFLSNEKTFRNDFALDDSWQSFWQALVQDGHKFGSHTWDHTYWQKDQSAELVLVKSQFGPNAHRFETVNARQYCHMLKQVEQRFIELTSRNLDPIWRAPGGKVSPQLIAMGKSCGFAHIGWSKAGFLGDELSSEKFSNSTLLANALANLRAGDIAMAHLGIWSRKDPWALGVLEPLIIGLKEKGYCFATIEK